MFVLLQSLFEYVKPVWEKRVYPAVEEYDVSKFGTAPGPLNPTIKHSSSPGAPCVK